MIIVTGGAGFIGSNIVKQLNNKGRNDILIVDDLTDGRKIRNIEMLDFADYIDYEEIRLWKKTHLIVVLSKWYSMKVLARTQ